MKKIIGIFILIFGISSFSFGAEIVIKTEGKVIRATLNDTNLSNEFLKILPLKMDMRNWNDREFYGKFQESFSIEEETFLETFSNGDVTYYPAGNSFAIFYDKENVSTQSGLIKMGEITSDLKIFKELPQNIEVYIEEIK